MAEFSGVVVAGARLGRKIGFPTLNISLPQELVDFLQSDIGFGVFVCDLKFDFVGFNLAKVYTGVMHFGPKGDGIGDVDGLAVFCEIHVLDFAHDVYGANVHVETGVKIRDIRKFASLEELKAQIFADVEFARGLV